VSGATARGSTITVSRRARALPLGAALWMVLCALVVLIAHAAGELRGLKVSEYWSGTISLIGFVILGWYSLRKRSLWFSLRVLRITGRILPASWQQRMIVVDRLETWRAVHITLGILVALPLWWHMSSGLMSLVEMLLAVAVALLLLSGVFGVTIQEYLPPAIEAMPEREVRLQDVASRIDATYVEAEEKVLGHPEAIVQAYLKNLKPILEADRIVPRWRLLRATLKRRDLGSEMCVQWHQAASQFGAADAPVWKELVDLTARKLNLEHNAFNLNFSTEWLTFHIVLALCTFGLLILHVVSVLFFFGL
jgi:hypothetical protein